MIDYEHIKNKVNNIFDKEILNKEERWHILSEIAKDLILKKIKFKNIIKAKKFTKKAKTPTKK